MGFRALLSPRRRLEQEALYRPLGGTHRALVLLEDGRVATGGSWRKVWILDPSGAGEPVELACGDPVNALAVLPGGRLAAALERDSGNLRIWDLGGVEPRDVAKARHRGCANVLVPLPDDRLASAGELGEVRVWDVGEELRGDQEFDADRGMRFVRTLKGHSGPVHTMTLLPDGRLASCSMDKSVRVWDATGRAKPVTLTGHTDSVNAIVPLSDHRVASASSDRTVRIWALTDPSTPVVIEHDGPVAALAVLPDGRLASLYRTGRVGDTAVGIWDVGGTAQPAGGQPGSPEFVVLPDGRLASGEGVWELPKTTGSFTLPRASARLLPYHEPGRTLYADALAVLPDGRLVAACLDSSVRIWGVPS
jgi:WD40 repeat protein